MSFINEKRLLKVRSILPEAVMLLTAVLKRFQGRREYLTPFHFSNSRISYFNCYQCSICGTHATLVRAVENAVVLVVIDEVLDVEIVVVVIHGIRDEITVNVTQYSEDWTCSLITNDISFVSLDCWCQRITHSVYATAQSCCGPTWSS